MGRLLKRATKILAWGVLAVVVLAGAAWVFRVPLFGGLVKNAIERRLSEALGGRYEIDEVGGSWIGDLEIRGLSTVEAPPEGLLVDLGAREARVRYDLRRVLSSDPLSGVEDVDVSGLRVDLDLRRPLSAGESGTDLDPALLDAFRGRVDIEAAVTARMDAGVIALEGLRLGYDSGGRLDVDVGEISLPDRFEVAGPLAGRVERLDDRRWRWTSSSVLGEVRVPEATLAADGRVVGVVEIADGKLDVVLADRTLEVTATSLDLARLPAWVPGLISEELSLPSAGTLRGKARLGFEGELAVDVSAETERLVWRSETIDSLRAEGRWQRGGEATLSRLDLSAANARAHVREAVLDPKLPFLLRDVAELSVHISSTRRLAPELERDLAVSLKAASEGARGLRIEQLTVQDDRLRIEAKGTARLPDETAAWPSTTVHFEVEGEAQDLAPLAVDLDGRVAFAGEIDGPLDTLGLALRITGEVRGQQVEQAEIEGTLSWPELVVARLEARAAEAAVEAQGRIVLDPLAVPELAGRLVIPDLDRVRALVAPEGPELAGRVEAEGRLRYDAEVLDVSARLQAAGIFVNETSLGDWAASLRSEGRRVFVEALDGRGSWGRVRGIGVVEPDAKRAVAEGLLLEVDGRSAALRAPLVITWSEDEVHVQDLDLGVEGARVTGAGLLRRAARTVEIPRLRIHTGDDTEIDASVTANWERQEATVLSLSLRSPQGNGRLNAPLRLTLRDRVVDADLLDVTLRGSRVVARASADLARSEARIERLEVTPDDPDLAVRLLSPALVRWDEHGWQAAELDIDALGGRITGHLSYGETFEGELAGRGYSLARFVPGVEGDIVFVLRGQGGTWALAAEVPQVRVRDWAGDLALRARQRSAGGIEILQLRLRGPHGGVVEGRGEFPYRVSEQGLERVAGVDAAFELEGTLGGVSRFTELADGPVRLWAHGDEQGIRVAVRVDDLGLCDESNICDDGIVRLEIDPDGIEGEIALASEELLKVQGRLRVDRGFDWTRPETVADLLEHGNVVADLSAIVQSWKPIAPSAPGLKRLEGGAGVDLRVRGRLKDPHVRGVITFDEFSFEGTTHVAPLERVNGRLVWEDRVINIEHLKGQMGYAPFEIKGKVELRPGGLPHVDLALHGENMQLLRTDWLRLRIDVDATAKGPIDSLHIAGDGTIVDMLFRKPVTLTGASSPAGTPEIVLFEIKTPAFSEMTFDLGIKADNTIRIRNNLLRMNASFEGRLGGTGLRPEFDGRLWFEGGEVFLPVTTLRRADGEITFRKEAPFRPRIQMTAQTRTRGYEMGVQIAGTLPDVSLYVFTEPRLSHEDAILMLATGSTSAELAEGGIMGQALQVVINLFGGSIFSSRGGDAEPGEMAFFERFEFRTEWDGPRLTEIRGQIQLSKRVYFLIQRDRFENTNLGLMWRLRFK